MTVLTMESGSGDRPAATTTPRKAAIPEGAGVDRPLRSGAWPRQVKVEITRIEHRLQIALVNNKSAYAKAVGKAIRAHLRDAEDVIRPRNVFARWFSPVDWYRGTSIEQAYRSLHAARVFLIELVADEDVDALVPGVLARVQSCLPATDPQRIELEKLPRADQKTKRAKLVRALERGYAASDEAHAHIRRFRNVLLCTAALIAFFTFVLVYQVAQHPAAVPLCFHPDITTAQVAMLQHQPTVSSRMRPPESTSTVASRLASTTGWWYGSSRTPVPSRMRLVTAATKVRHSNGSAYGSDGGSSIGPIFAPGYRATCSGR